MSPPAKFIASAAGTLVSADPSTYNFAVPLVAQPGQVAIVIVHGAQAGNEFPAGQVGWVATYVASGHSIGIYRRQLQAGDKSFTFAYNGADVSQAACILIYDDLDPSAAIGLATVTAIVASVNFVCPSRTLIAYSDLYLGIVVVESGSVAVAPPAGTVERFEAAFNFAGVAAELEVFELLPEVVGATGTKTSTTGANQSGLAASILFPADPVLVPASLDASLPGGVGIWGNIRPRP